MAERVLVAGTSAFEGADTTKTKLTFELTTMAEVRQEVVTEQVVKIGRDRKCDLHLSDNKVMRMHAIIEVAAPDDMAIIDLGGPTGSDGAVTVNGVRVAKTQIKVGDRIRIGDTFIVLTKAEAVGVRIIMTAAEPEASRTQAAAPATSPEAAEAARQEALAALAILDAAGARGLMFEAIQRQGLEELGSVLTHIDQLARTGLGDAWFKSLGSLAARLLRSRGFEVEKARAGEGMVVRWARQDEPASASEEAKPC